MTDLPPLGADARRREWFEFLRRRVDAEKAFAQERVAQHQVLHDLTMGSGGDITAFLKRGQEAGEAADRAADAVIEWQAADHELRRALLADGDEKIET